VSDEQTTADDPSGPGWRWVEAREVLRDDDMQQGSGGVWRATRYSGQPAIDNKTFRRRIEPEPPQPNDSEQETIDSWKFRLAKMLECNPQLEALMAEAERGAGQANAELQELRERVATWTADYDRTKCQLWDAVEARQKAERELASETKRYRDAFRDHHRDGQRQIVEALRIWLRPVLEVVADDPEDSAPLAVAVLGCLPQIANRLIEETVDEARGQR
jgi:hypothetical protein